MGCADSWARRSGRTASLVIDPPDGCHALQDACHGHLFAHQLNIHIGVTLAMELQYLAAAAYYDSQTMPRMAQFFYTQALEQRTNALRMVRYLLRTAEAVVPGVEAPISDFGDVVAPVALAVDRTSECSEQINELLQSARRESDYAAEQFMQWFVGAQSAATATLGELLAVVTRNIDRLGNIEEYVAREHLHGGQDPTAPRQAGV
jgi:ferritin